MLECWFCFGFAQRKLFSYAENNQVESEKHVLDMQFEHTLYWGYMGNKDLHVYIDIQYFLDI